MDERGRQTNMPRGALPRDNQHVESVIWGLAIFLALLFAAGQVFTVLAAAPAAVAFYAETGAMPAFVGVVSVLGPVGLAALLAVLDGLLLVLFVWLARRYWVGLVFLPPMLYLGIGSVVLWLLVSDMLASAVLS